RSARSAVWGESLLHDNGQVPSAPTAKGHQRGCSGASDARPSAPPCTFRRLSEAGWELLSPHHCIFQYDYFTRWRFPCQPSFCTISNVHFWMMCAISRSRSLVHGSYATVTVLPAAMFSSRSACALPTVPCSADMPSGAVIVRFHRSSVPWRVTPTEPAGASSVTLSGPLPVLPATFSSQMLPC